MPIKSKPHGSERPPTRIEVIPMDVSTIWADDASTATSNMKDYPSSTLRSMTRNSFHMNEGGDNYRSIHTRQVAKSGYNVRVTEKTPSPHSLLAPNQNDRPKLSHSSSAPTIKRHNRGQSPPGKGVKISVRDFKTDRSPKPAVSSKISPAEKLYVGLPRGLSPPTMEALYRRSIQHDDSANVSSSRHTHTNTARMSENARESQRSLVAHASSWHHSTSKSPQKCTKMTTSSPVRVRLDRSPSSKFNKSKTVIKAIPPHTLNRQSSAERLMFFSNLPPDFVPDVNEIKRNDGNQPKPSSQHRKSNNQAFQTSLHHQSDIRHEATGNTSSISLRLPDESTNEIPLVRKFSQRPQQSQTSPKLLTIEVSAMTTNELQRSPRFSGDAKTTSPSRTHLHSSSCPNTPNNAAAYSTCSRLVPGRFNCCQILEPTKNQSVESDARNVSGRFIVSDHLDLSDEQFAKIIPKVIYVNHCQDHSEDERVSHFITKLDLSPIKSRRRQSFGKNLTDLCTLGTHSNHDFPNSNIMPFRNRDVSSNLPYQRRRSMGQVTNRIDDLVSSHLHSFKVSESVASELTFDSSFVPRRKSFGPVARHGDELGRWIRAPRRRSLGPPSIITALRRSPTPA